MSNNLSLIKKQFFNSLKRGTGEAYLIFLDNPQIDFSNSIIKGAIKNYAYDEQCEGSRAKYIYRFIQKSNKKHKIIQAVLARLETEKDDYWGLDQMCDLAVLFFKAGFGEAKTALYNRFEKNLIKDYEFCGKLQMMEMDGIKGVLKVAEIVGRKILEQNDWEDGHYTDSYQAKHKELSVYAELLKASKKNKFIKAYYNTILKSKVPVPNRKKSIKFSYQVVKEKIESNNFRSFSSDAANHLSIDEVNRLANDFLAEKNKHKQELYLRFFAYRQFPFDYRPILKIAGGKNPPKTRLVEYSVYALKYFEGRDIRKLAFEKIASERNPYKYMELLVSNYKKGDGKVLNEIANRSDNYDFIHSIGFGFLSVYEANKLKEMKEPLETLYKKMNCGECRERLIKLLMDNNVLSDSIRKEIKFDSNSDVRKLFNSTKLESKN